MVWLWLTYLQLWKIDIFSPWGHFSLWPVGPRSFFASTKLHIRGPRNWKNDQNSKIFLELERTKSKLSVDIFLASQDHLVALKSNLKKYFCRKVVNSCKPPPWLVNCVIYIWLLAPTLPSYRRGVYCFLCLTSKRYKIWTRCRTTMVDTAFESPNHAL